MYKLAACHWPCRCIEISPYQIVELDSGNTLVDTCNNLHGDGGGVDMVRVKTVTQPRDTGSDLVECNTLLAPIWYALVQACRDVSLTQSFCCQGGKLICCAPNGFHALEEVADVYREDIPRL